MSTPEYQSPAPLALVLEDSLIWSVRIKNGLKALGFDVIVLERLPESLPPARVAIVNLGVTEFARADVILRLKDVGCLVVAHAGHKEKDLMALGADIGADVLATNSELTHKLAQIVSPAQ